MPVPVAGGDPLRARHPVRGTPRVASSPRRTLPDGGQGRLQQSQSQLPTGGLLDPDQLVELGQTLTTQNAGLDEGTGPGDTEMRDRYVICLTGTVGDHRGNAVGP